MTELNVSDGFVAEIDAHLNSYVRKPFAVQGVQVTDDNLDVVAEWCGGDVRTKPESKKYPETRLIKVPVKRPLTHRQTLAYPGDWVLFNGKGFKVYTNEAFEASFDPAQGELL